jgi:hypothetical protein
MFENFDVRGFPGLSFKDTYDKKCSIQMSSLATEARIWFGVDDPEPKIMASDAIKVGIDTKGQKAGWVNIELPEEILIHTRMHLNRAQVAELLPILQKFVDTGEI